MTRRADAFPPRPADPAAALAPYDGPWGRPQAAHLLRRALFGAPPHEVDALAAKTPAEALASLFGAVDEDEDLWNEVGEGLARTGDRRALAGWWLVKLVRARRVPGPRLTVAWHDHFACAASKVDDLPAMWRQHALLVERGEGPFGALVSGIVRDAAMLRFLDGDSNRRGQPNENLARELLELFTLGLGPYTEHDVREAARALTGATVRHGRYHFEPLHHESGLKTVLGRPVDGPEALCRAAVEHPACARFVAAALWRHYVSPDPPGDVVDLLAERWRARDLDTSWLLWTLLRSTAFYARESSRCLVRSPVDYVVGVARTTGARPDGLALAAAADAMGQRLFEPPGVQGWEGGAAWIHAAAWIERVNFAARVAEGDPRLVRDVDRERLAPAEVRRRPRALVERLAEVFLAGDLDDDRAAALAGALEAAGGDGERLAAAVHAVLCLPECHLS